jgi:pimeloyl-ACP methyl ester carboxylesterase
MTAMKRWAKRLGLGALALIAATIMIGAGYEVRMRRQAAVNHPAPGQLVDIGGRKLHLDCRGSGTPIVILEAGLDMNGSLAWAKVHDSIAATSRTCAYSRAGLMWSDDSPNQQDATTVAADLHALLAAAGEQSPYVMVGHSLGGPYIMTFTKHHEAEVAGLVFVDASHPEQMQRFNEVLGRDLEPPVGPLRAAAALAWAGVVRAVMPGPDPTDAVGQATAAYAPTSIGPMLEEMDALDSTMAQAGSFRQLGSRPLVVLTAMAPTDTNQLKQLKMTREESVRFQGAWRTMHEEQATWSTQSEHVLVPDATHYVQNDRPDIVIAAVRKVVGLVRNPVAVPSLTP